MLVPLYTYVLDSSAEYGIVTNLYAWTALLLVILTYGMETGYFRFANKNRDEADKVYSTTLIAVGFTSFLFAAACVLFSHPIAGAMGYTTHPEFISMLGVVVAMDAFGCIPFAYLRYKNRPIKFAALKLFMIFANILFNLFFLIGCPWLLKHAPSSVGWFYNPHYGVGYVFVANLISTALVTLALIPDMRVKLSFDYKLLRQMLVYSLPLLALGIAGIMNQTLDKILFPFLMPDKARAATDLGIYGATSKIAMVMLMFTQAFRYAYEPFIFAQHKDKNSLEAYADAMKFFIVLSLLIFLGMVLYLDVFKYIIQRNYWEGLKVVPIVLFSFIFQGIFFNLSLWYKLTDQTMYGAWFSALGTILIVVINVIFVPIYSYTASAWAAFVCYFVIMMVSYYFGQKHMPIKYDLKTIGKYTLLTIVLYLLGAYINFHHTGINLLYRTVLLFSFLYYMTRHDFPLNKLPFINKFFRK